MNDCRNCQHCRPEAGFPPGDARMYDFAKCAAPQVHNDELPEFCTVQRNGGWLASLIDGRCGKAARWFEAYPPGRNPPPTHQKPQPPSGPPLITR